MNAELPERCGNFPIFTYPYIDKSIQCKVLGYIVHVYLGRPDILHAARKQEKKNNCWIEAIRGNSRSGYAQRKLPKNT